MNCLHLTILYALTLVLYDMILNTCCLLYYIFSKCEKPQLSYLFQKPNACNDLIQDRGQLFLY